MSSTEPYAPPTVWGRGLRGTHLEWFCSQVERCTSADHCRAAIEAEVDRASKYETDVRRERIAILNARIKTIREVWGQT